MPKPIPLPGKQITPTERLAVTPDGGKSTGTYEKSLLSPSLPQAPPTVRLALGADLTKTVGDKAFREDPPTVRLAHVVGAQGDRTLEEGGSLHDPRLPALLISYYYLENFLKHRHKYFYRDWVMDSGAFSAHASGVDINLDDYIEKCRELLSSDPKLTEVFALDVIGDWKEGVANTEKMWAKGIPAIPAFHYGEPWSLLKSLAKDYPKIALGGCVGKRDKDKFAAECFGRIWPKKIHGFGFGSEKSLMLFPWHSVDATNWEMGPCAYGRWAAFGGAHISVRGSNQNLRAEVEWYLELERKARVRWKKEMQQLADLPADARSIRLVPIPKQGEKNLNRLAFQAPDGRTVRLAVDTGAAAGQRMDATLGALSPPVVRLVGNGDVVCERQLKAFGPPSPKPLDGVDDAS